MACTSLKTPAGRFLMKFDSETADRYDSIQNLILERNAFRVVLLQPNLRAIIARKDLEVILVANLLVRVDANPDCH